MSRAEVPPHQSALRKLQNQTLGRFTASTTTHDNNTHSAHAIRTSQNHNITKDVLALTHMIESASKYPEKLRRVTYCDVKTGKRLKFLTNNFTLPALTIAQIYKQRWQVE